MTEDTGGTPRLDIPAETGLRESRPILAQAARVWMDQGRMEGMLR